MVVEPPTVSPLGSECARGHDLTKPGAWLYRANGFRECRACAMEARNPNKRWKPIGTFD